MSAISIWHWLIVGLVLWSLAAAVIAAIRILRRMGYSGWWCILMFIWPFWVIGLVKLSKADWPALAEPSGD